MIHVENLTKYYGDLCAVDRIGFTVQRGEILGLLGPNGAGKTTTLRMLTGFMQPDAGTVRVGDHRLEEHLLEIKKIMGYLPESAPLYRDMLVYDYLGFVADLRRMDGARRSHRIREIADLCAIDKVMHQPIGELSKGYKQRVGLAHAMLDDPQILVLDEPTSGLDPNQIVEIREIIRRIGKEKTIIFSTHILSEAEATCDRVVIIHRGKIAADSDTAHLKQTLGGRTRIMITLGNADRAAATAALGAVAGVAHLEAAGEGDGELRLVLDCEAAADPRAELYARVRETDWVLLDFHRETQSLEDVFRELTKEN